MDRFVVDAIRLPGDAWWIASDLSGVLSRSRRSHNVVDVSILILLHSLFKAKMSTALHACVRPLISSVFRLRWSCHNSRAEFKRILGIN